MPRELITFASVAIRLAHTHYHDRPPFQHAPNDRAQLGGEPGTNGGNDCVAEIGLQTGLEPTAEFDAKRKQERDQSGDPHWRAIITAPQRKHYSDWAKANELRGDA